MSEQITLGHNGRAFNLPNIDKDKLNIFAQALKNQSVGMNLESFIKDQLRKEVDSIKRNTNQMNFRELKFLYHHLLSTCTALGLLSMSDLCREAEQSCIDKNDHALEDKMQELDLEFERILALTFYDDGIFEP